jgi:osmotically-inducible protein OsmY
MRQITDSEIEQRVLRELRSEKCIASKELCVFVCGAVVTLHGSVRSMRDKLAAKRAARRAQGVVAVVNEVRIRPVVALTQESLIVVPHVPPARVGQVVAA